MGKFSDRLLGWDHITKEHALALVVVLCIMYFFIFYVWIGLRKRSELCEKIDGACIIGCSPGKCPPDWTRGDTYTIGGGYAKPQCLLTSWEFSHFIFHMFIGYFFNIWVSLGLGVSFELYEVIAYDCASYIDIIANTSGCIIGAVIASYR